MNAIIHGLDEAQIERGDTMINPRVQGRQGPHHRPRHRGRQSHVEPGLSPRALSRTTRSIASAPPEASLPAKGDWAWLQHTLACLNERGRAAVVLDTGAVTRGSGAKHEDRERNIRRWFVERDLIDGVILLPDNLFYNTSAAGIIVLLSRRKPEARKGKVVLVNASRRVGKGRPKNYIPDEDIRPIAAMFLKGEPVEGEVAVITGEQAAGADYNLSPSRWVGQIQSEETRSIPDIVASLEKLSNEIQTSDEQLFAMLKELPQ